MVVTFDTLVYLDALRSTRFKEGRRLCGERTASPALDANLVTAYAQGEEAEWEEEDATELHTWKPFSQYAFGSNTFSSVKS